MVRPVLVGAPSQEERLRTVRQDKQDGQRFQWILDDRPQERLKNTTAFIGLFAVGALIAFEEKQ